MTSRSEITISTNKKIELVNITRKIEEFVQNNTGNACLVFVPHATASLLMNEDEQGLRKDFENFIKKLSAGEYYHNKIDDNAEAHLLAGLYKPFLLIPVTNKKLVRGTWQEIFFVELDGPRSKRRIVLQMI